MEGETGVQYDRSKVIHTKVTIVYQASQPTIISQVYIFFLGLFVQWIYMQEICLDKVPPSVIYADNIDKAS